MLKKVKQKRKISTLFLNFISPEIKFIIILDADSRPGKESLSILYNNIKKTSSRIGWIQGNYSVNRGGNKIITGLDESENRLSRKLEKIFSSKVFFSGHDAIFKREVLERADGFNPNCLLEDKDLSVRLHKLGFNGQREENYQSSSEACPTWRDFYRQRSRWVQGGYEINKLGAWGLVFFVLIFVVAVVFFLGWKIIFPLLCVSFFLLGGFFLFFPLVIIYRTILSIKIILGCGPKKFIASKRNITDASHPQKYRLKINNGRGPIVQA